MKNIGKKCLRAAVSTAHQKKQREREREMEFSRRYHVAVRIFINDEHHIGEVYTSFLSLVQRAKVYGEWESFCEWQNERMLDFKANFFTIGIMYDILSSLRLFTRTSMLTLDTKCPW